MKRSVFLGAAVGVAAVVGAMGVAWACTPVASTLTITPAVASPGAELQVRGAGLADRPVEIRWNSVTGPVLATAAGGTAPFTAPVVVPPSGDGVYYLVAVVDGRAVARAALDVGGTAPPVAQLAPAPYASSPPSQGSGAGTERALGTGVAVLAAGMVVLGALTLAVSARRRRALVGSR